MDLAAGTGEMLALIFSQLLHGLPAGKPRGGS